MPGGPFSNARVAFGPIADPRDKPLGSRCLRSPVRRRAELRREVENRILSLQRCHGILGVHALCQGEKKTREPSAPASRTTGRDRADLAKHTQGDEKPGTETLRLHAVPPINPRRAPLFSGPGLFPNTYTVSRARVNAATARSRCSRLCAAETWVRMRAASLGTTG